LPRKAKEKDPARELAVQAARIAKHDNCQDIVVLDLRGVSPITDYFVIATGTSDRQLRSVADDIANHGRKIGHVLWKMAGEDTAEWIVMDFVDVVVHLFDQEHRRYYDLELLWGEAPKVRWQARAAKKPEQENGGTR
jgi:ribosome-associated protein